MRWGGRCCGEEGEVGRKVLWGGRCCGEGEGQEGTMKDGKDERSEKGGVNGKNVGRGWTTERKMEGRPKSNNSGKNVGRGWTTERKMEGRKVIIVERKRRREEGVRNEGGTKEGTMGKK